MTIFVNGDQVDAGDARTISDLIRNHQLRKETTLVECNGIALHKRDWATRMLQKDDRLEILQVAAGG